MRNIQHSLALLLSILTFFGSFYTASAQVPTITSFSPTSGPIGTTATITGTNFNTTAANNIVYFGAVRATVKFSSDIPGDQVIYNNKKYVICDPTYINADVGACMPQFKSVSPNVIRIE